MPVKFCFIINLLYWNIFHSAENHRDVTLSISMHVKLLDVTCGGSLYFKTRNSTETWHINCLNGNRQSDYYWFSLTMDKNIKWDIGYLNNRTSYDDKRFWISITGDLISF